MSLIIPPVLQLTLFGFALSAKVENIQLGIVDESQSKESRDLIAVLKNAKTDSRVKAVALDLDGFTGGGQTTLTDLSAAIRDVRQSRKPVLA